MSCMKPFPDSSSISFSGTKVTRDDDDKTYARQSDGQETEEVSLSIGSQD